ncbi:uncharacterized protein LOC141830539 [Curcuma longa]|uniref:uncharacterized protein LOC141830539 n=1 Tax=Curcuma longa TaxID=136217 RepID=UPI003D9ED831
MAYPQSYGQAEVVNRELVKGLKVKLDQVQGNWVDELPDILWAYRTTPRDSTQMTPFHLVYGGEAVIPVEVEEESSRVLAYGSDNSDKRHIELDLITETRERATIRLKFRATELVDLLTTGWDTEPLSSQIYLTTGQNIELVDLPYDRLEYRATKLTDLPYDRPEQRATELSDLP